ncbi:hypothetical protein N9O17_01990 [Candidatus Pelagibacter sp.]|nr:hypothetical protein [Candidatus Pelagibacter sp.]
MIVKFVRIVLILTTFVFTTGFLPFFALLGPGITIATSGSMYKATAQLIIDHHIKKKTGKNSFTYLKEEVIKKNEKEDLDAVLKQLIETRVKIAHETIIQQDKKNNLNKDPKQLEKKIIITRKKIDIKKINQ